MKVDILKTKAKQIKRDILQISYEAGVGHIGSAFSIADILTVLYFRVLKVNPKKPLDNKRDRFILSKGHAAAALYATLKNKGFFSEKELLTYCKDGGLFGVHTEYHPELGIEAVAGSLGHGLSIGAGMALGLKKTTKKSRKVPRVFVLTSDAELNEGSVWEALMFAGHHKLDNLIAIIDDNNYQAFGRAKEIINLQPIENKLRNFGWDTKLVNGHDLRDMLNAFKTIPFKKGKPSIVIAKTKTASGISFIEDTQEAHYLPLNDETYKTALKDIEKQ